MKTIKNQATTLVMSLLLLPTLFTACTSTATVRQGPPAPRVEVIPVAPSPRHAWIPGHYVRRGRNYAWVNGSYRQTPPRYSAWVPGAWQQARRGPVWVEGHWQ